MIILVNVFALLSFVLFMLGKISSMACLTFSLLWIILMISFWFLLPFTVYKRAITFKHEFSMSFNNNGFSLEHEKGSKSWQWQSLKSYLESPHFFHLYFDSRSFLLVPKDGCRDGDEVHELRQLIQTNVKKGTIRG
jgi:signal transduction histidine kinase